MKTKVWLLGGVGAAVLGIIAACSSDDADPAPAADGGAASSGSTSGDGTSSGGTSSGGTSGGGTSSGGTSSGGTDSGGPKDAGRDADGDAGETFGITVGPPITGLPGEPGVMRFNATTQELWLATRAKDDAGVYHGALVVLDPQLALKRTVIAKDTVFDAIEVAPDTNTVYVAKAGELDRVDGATGTVTKVSAFQGSFEIATSMAYDSMLHRLYVAVSGGYLLQIDTTTNTLTKTYPKPDALGSFDRVAAFPGSTKLYLVAADKNFSSVTAGFETTTGALSDVSSAKDAGWSQVFGPVAFASADGGSNGFAAANLKAPDAGAALVLIDPSVYAQPGDSILGVFRLGTSPFPTVTPPYNTYLRFVVIVRDACGRKKIRFYSVDDDGPATGFYASSDFTTANANLITKDYKPQALELLAPPPGTGGNVLHFAYTQQPELSGPATATLEGINVIVDNPSVAVACP